MVESSMMAEALVRGSLESGALPAKQEGVARAMVRRVALETKESYDSHLEPDCESVPEEMQALKKELKME